MSLLVLAAETPAVGAEAGDAFMIGVAVVFMVAAIGLFFLELLMPSFGIITLAGITCAVVSVAAAFSVSRFVGVIFVAVVLVSIPLLVYLAVKIVKRTGLVLRPDASTGSEEQAALAPGARGVSLTVLRPSGTASFDGRKVSVVTAGEMVERDVQIEVVRVEGIRTVVRPVRV